MISMLHYAETYQTAKVSDTTEADSSNAVKTKKITGNEFMHLLFQNHRSLL